MKLSDLQPRFVGAGGEGITRNGKPVPRRTGVGLSFKCPCGCGKRQYVDFENPLDGGEPYQTNHPHWKRTGDTFEAMTLQPSILSSKEKGGCGWHGWIRNGEIVNA